MSKDPESRKPETAAIRTGLRQTSHREHSAPLFLTSSFTFEDAEDGRALFANERPGNIYSRFTNPNTDEFVEKMCALEGASDGLAVASGMAAVFTTLAALLNAGDHVLASRSLFGSTHQVLTQLLPRWNITHTYAPVDRQETWESLIKPETRLCIVETPANPTLALIDLSGLADLCRRHDVLLVVDNVFATPILQQPIHHGADLVIHSATKYIDGQGRGIGGVIVGRKSLVDEIKAFARHAGPCLSPFNAWMFSKSLETLAVRMEKHCANALRLAQYLETRSDVERIYYPFLPSFPQYELARRQMKGGGGIVTFVVAGGLERGRRFLDALEMCSLTANLGDTRTIATHPASTTHSKLAEEERRAVGILPGLIRISTGLEHVDDIIDDIGRALDRSA